MVSLLHESDTLHSSGQCTTGLKAPLCAQLKTASITAKVLSDEMRQKVEAQNARMASAEEAPTITPRETADLMRELVEILQPRETVTRALKRLRPVKPKSIFFQSKLQDLSHFRFRFLILGALAGSPVYEDGSPLAIEVLYFFSHFHHLWAPN